MRISTYAQNALQAASLKADGTRQESRSRSSGTGVQIKLSEAGKALSRATTAKEDLAGVDQGLAKLQKALDSAKAANATAADKQAAQADFAKARVAVTEAAKTQSARQADAPAEVRKAGTVQVEALGKGASKSIASVADLATLDLTTATADQLTEATKVVTAARNDLASRSAVVEKPVERLSRTVTVLENVEAALNGTSQSKAQQRQLQALQVLQQAFQAQAPLQTGINLFA